MSGDGLDVKLPVRQTRADHMIRPDGSPVRVITQSESLHDQSHRVDQVTAAKPPHGCLRGQGTAQDSGQPQGSLPENAGAAIRRRPWAVTYR